MANILQVLIKMKYC